MDARRLVLEDFADKVGETFSVLDHGGSAPDLTLKEAALLRMQPGVPAARPSFSLIFAGPPDLLLPQRSYNLENGSLGQVEIFITPIGRNAEAITYQAVFN